MRPALHKEVHERLFAFEVGSVLEMIQQKKVDVDLVSKWISFDFLLTKVNVLIFSLQK